MARDRGYSARGNDPEPGASRDNAARGTVSPLTRPLDAVIGGSAGVVAAVVVPVVGFAIVGTRINVPVVIIFAAAAAALAFAASGAWTLAFGIRRWRWRKRNVARTGGVYLKPWERSPSPENRDWR